MNIQIEISDLADRPSMKAFRKYICNKYRVENVDDVPITIDEYVEQMTIFESGWGAREQALLDKLLGS